MRWLDGFTDLMDLSLSKLWEMVKNRDAWHTFELGGLNELDTTERLNCLILSYGHKDCLSLSLLPRMKMLNCKSTFKVPVHLCQWERGGCKKKENRVGETQETSENSWQILLCDMLAHECRGNKHVQNLSVSDQFHLIL